MTDTVEKFLNRILKDCEGKRYLFRGTTKIHEEINSSLYRWAKDKVVFHEEYSPFDMEKEILERAKRHFAVGVSNIEVLTDLQHFKGKTNLIDFSCNLYIALFFACDEEHHKEDGKLIILDPAEIGQERQEIDYTKLQSSSKPFSIKPANTQSSQKRAIFQSSVFVYPPSGYINKDLCKIVSVPADLKKPILDHLRKIHNIHPDTIYNDLIGFIANEKNYETAKGLFYQGVASLNKGEYKEVIEKYDQAIELNSNHAEFYNNRGFAKNKLRQYHEAIADYDKAIELDSNYVMAYTNRGVVKNNLKQYREAIADYNKAIELNPNHAEAYNNRGNVEYHLEQHQGAITYYDKAIELNSNYAEFYNNRGVAKDKLRQYQEAINDFNKTIELNPNYAIAYNNRGLTENNLGQYQEAIGDFSKAIELKPDYADAYNNRGLAYQALGRNQDADENFKMADKLNSDEAS